MVNKPEKESIWDQSAALGWVLIGVVIVAVTLSTRLQLARSADLQDAHAPGQAVEVTSSR